jgi:hypothetical protein
MIGPSAVYVTAIEVVDVQPGGTDASLMPPLQPARSNVNDETASVVVALMYFSFLVVVVVSL